MSSLGECTHVNDRLPAALPFARDTVITLCKDSSAAYGVRTCAKTLQSFEPSHEPPSRLIVAPLTYDPPLDSRKIAAPAASHDSPSRPEGLLTSTPHQHHDERVKAGLQNASGAAHLAEMPFLKASSEGWPVPKFWYASGEFSASSFV